MVQGWRGTGAERRTSKRGCAGQKVGPEFFLRLTLTEADIRDQEVERAEQREGWRGSGVERLTTRQNGVSGLKVGPETFST